MAATRITRAGVKLIASTLFLPKGIDRSYAAKSNLKRHNVTSKSALMVKVLVENKP